MNSGKSNLQDFEACQLEVNEFFQKVRMPSRSLGVRVTLSGVRSSVWKGIVVLGSMLAFGHCKSALAKEAAKPVPRGFASFLEQHCTKCHDAETKKGDLDLATLPYDLEDLAVFQRWERLFDRVVDGEMPPPKKTQPPAAERQAFLTGLKGHLLAADLQMNRTVGRVQSRRLTRSEFERSLQDLLGIYVPLQAQLPEDPFTEGFNTVAKGQQISPNQLETYLTVIDEALNLAFKQALSPRLDWSKSFGWQELQRQVTGTVNQARGPEGRSKQGDVVSWNTSNQEFYGRMEATKVPADGWYKIRLRALAVNPPKGERLTASVFGGRHVSTAPERHLIGAIEAEETPADFEFISWMKSGELLRVQVCDDSLPKKKAQRHPQNREAVEDLDGQGHVGIAVQSIEIERVYPGFEPAQTRSLLFGELPIELEAGSASKKSAPGQVAPIPKDPKRVLQGLVLAFANRAFRRPVKLEEIEGHVQLASSRMATGAPFSVALQAAYRSVLMSPRFLYFEESPGRLKSHALASRLSFFLWGAPPDAELRTVADSGKLLEPAVLVAQVDRMLVHGHAKRFIRNFTDQWLKLREIDATNPDEKLYGEFDDLLKDAMVEETQLFFWDLIRRNLSAANIVDSKYTFANHRLAKHYGLQALPRRGMQEVALKPEHHRGGIITHASILKVTANGTTTSPVVRGVWMLEKIGGQRVPPPPASVPAIEPDIRGAKTIREQLEKHRSQESCAACHVKIDPPGFALENYDVIGGWRTNYRAVNEKGIRKEGPKVDASYHFPGGQSFKDLNDLKQMLLKRPDLIAKNLVHHLVTYSTGAPPSFADREVIDAVVASAKPTQYGVRSLIQALVQSPIFLNK